MDRILCYTFWARSIAFFSVVVAPAFPISFTDDTLPLTVVCIFFFSVT